MAQEPHSSRNQNQHQRQVQQILQHEDPDDEVSEEIVPLPYRKAYEMAELFAATRIGQFVMNRGDSLLKIIEMTAKWSLPRAQQEDKLHRPLPWIPFLVLIISLRLARVWISVAALMIGNAPVKAEDVVYFIQTRRRKLRYLRLQGVKQFNENSSKKISAGYRQSNLMSQLKILLSRAFCSPGKQRPTESHKIYFVSNSQTTNALSNQQAAKRPRADSDVDDDADANLSVEQMLERYANENVNADDDPDFVPEENEAPETSSASSDSDSDDEVAESEQNSNGKMETTMPVPIIEIKKEINNEVETLPENGPTNGGEHRTTDVGSPPDFNALQQESLKTPSPDTSAPHNLEPKVAEENHCATLDANKRTKNQRQGADHSSKHSHGHSQGHGHGNGGSQHHQFYKGRQNRQQHFEK